MSSGSPRRPPLANGAPEVPPANLDWLPFLLTVAEAAGVLRVGRSWVYEHAADLGAVKLGTGQTAPLRIPRNEVQRIVNARSPRHDLPWPPPRGSRPKQTDEPELRPRPRL